MRWAWRHSFDGGGDASEICDAYVDIVEMAKEHMDAEQARQLVSHLKKLRYQFVCKFAALADLGDADDGK